MAATMGQSALARKAGWPSLLAGLALALAVNGLGVLLFPIQGYLIACHEFFHALAGWLTGASVASIDTQFTHGTTWTAGGWFVVISSAGYLGTAAMGAALLRYCARPWARFGMLGFCAALFLALLVKGQWGLGWASAMAVNAVLFCALLRYQAPALLAFLGCLFCAMCFDDIKVYLFLMTSQTDAGILARHLGASILAWPIALAFAGVSGGLWWAAAKGLIKEERSGDARL